MGSKVVGCMKERGISYGNDKYGTEPFKFYSVK